MDAVVASGADVLAGDHVHHQNPMKSVEGEGGAELVCDAGEKDGLGDGRKEGEGVVEGHLEGE